MCPSDVLNPSQVIQNGNRFEFTIPLDVGDFESLWSIRGFPETLVGCQPVSHFDAGEGGWHHIPADRRCNLVWEFAYKFFLRLAAIGNVPQTSHSFTTLIDLSKTF